LSDPTGLYQLPGGLVEKGDTAASIAGVLNNAYGLQYGAFFTASALIAFNGREPVVGSYYTYLIDLTQGSRTCGGCSGGTSGNGGSGTYYPPVSSPGAPNALSSPPMSQNGGSGTYARSTPGINMYSNCAIPISSCAQMKKTAEYVGDVVLIGGVIYLTKGNPIGVFSRAKVLNDLGIQAGAKALSIPGLNQGAMGLEEITFANLSLKNPGTWITGAITTLGVGEYLYKTFTDPKFDVTQGP
jgi:hypothetical protein